MGTPSHRSALTCRWLKCQLLRQLLTVSRSTTGLLSSSVHLPQPLSAPLLLLLVASLSRIPAASRRACLRFVRRCVACAFLASVSVMFAVCESLRAADVRPGERELMQQRLFPYVNRVRVLFRVKNGKHSSESETENLAQLRL